MAKEYQNEILNSFTDDDNEHWEDILNNSKYNLIIKIFLARLDKFLNILIKDEYWRVRQEVARQSYGLDILVNDKNTQVSNEAKMQLKYL